MDNPLISNALGAYNNAAKIGGSGNTLDARDTAGPSFSDLVTTGIEKAIDVQKTSETVSADAVLGRADLNDVVQAISNAEATLDMVVSIRDRIIDAYETILRMPI